MKVKRVLRFYFSAEKLNGALDNLILKHALSPFADGEEAAAKICRLAERKALLSDFWNYLDGVISRMCEGDVRVLEYYALSRGGVSKDRLKEVKRCAVKFRRRAVRLSAFEEQLRLIGEYWCLL